MLACRSTLLLPLTRRLAAVGRMAFSNYIISHACLHDNFLRAWLRAVWKSRTRRAARYRAGDLGIPTRRFAGLVALFSIWPARMAMALVDLPAMGAVSAACFRLAVLRRLFRPLPGFRPTLSNPGGLVFVDTPNTRGFLAARNEDCREPDNLPLRVLSHSISFCAPAH